MFTAQTVTWLRRNSTDSLKYQSVSQSACREVYNLWRQLFEPELKIKSQEWRQTSYHLITSASASASSDWDWTHSAR